MVFTFDITESQGMTPYRIAFAPNHLDRGDRRVDGAVRSSRRAADRDLPGFIATTPVLPRHATDAAHFEDASLAPPIASGPYVVAEVKAGERIVLRRNPHYWGADVPSRRGQFNFERDRARLLPRRRRHVRGVQGPV